MRSKHLLASIQVVAAFAATTVTSAQTPLGSTFTYQGRLTTAGTPVNQNVDFYFTICDSENGDCGSGETIVFDGQPGNHPPIDVVDGLFTVDLDFGTGVFDGDARWLEIDVRSHDPDNASLYQKLMPRQPIMPAPYALFALNGPGDGAWEASGNDIFYDAGRVGIGTQTPGGALEVVGPVRSRDAGAGFYMFNPNNSNASAHLSWLNDTARIRVGGSGPGANGGFSIQRIGDQTLFRVTDNRRVGIIEENPLVELHVTGESIGLLAGALENDEVVVEAQDAVMGLYSTSQGPWGSAIALKEVSGGAIVDTWGIVRQTSPNGSDLSITYGPSDNYANNETIAAFGSDGDVGIGTASPSAKLAVHESAGLDPALSVTQAGSGISIDAEQTLGNNSCARFQITNSNGAATTLIANTSGSGGAASFSQSNTGATTPAVMINADSSSSNHFNLSVVQGGNGSAGNFFCNDASGGGNGVVARVVGSGNAAELTAEGTGVALEANHTSATSNAVRFERLADSGSGSDLLELRSGAGSDDNMQFIECERGGDFKFRVWGDGDVTADGAFTSGGADFAEMIRVSDGAASVEPGDVMVIDVNGSRAVRRSGSARSTLVAGIYSTKPGLVGSENDWDQIAEGLPEGDAQVNGEQLSRKPIELGRMIDEIPLAVVGIVPCKVSTENGAIRPGDLLVTSSIPGHAMRDDGARAGTIVGKALGALDDGTGVIRVLVTLQ